MARVLITGSTEGLGRSAATALIGDGHQVVLHARNDDRAAALEDLPDRDVSLVVGDLAIAGETHVVADQVNALGRMDAVIHNAGVYADDDRQPTPEGHPTTLAVNVVAPYLLTAAIARPSRLVYISSRMHLDGQGSLRDIEWRDRAWDGMQAYCDSKLFVTALALAVARRWPDVASHAVNPGWVPTRMGGPLASDDLHLGCFTQSWLAVSDAPETAQSGGYWFHQMRQAPHPAALDEKFQDSLVNELASLTGVVLP